MERPLPESRHGPAVNGAGRGGEVDSELDSLFAGGQERFVIAFLIDLAKGGLWRLVALQLDDIDESIRVKDNVDPAV